MKLKSVLPVWVVVIGLAGFHAAAQMTGTAMPQAITVSDPRPIAAALDILERKYHVAISYEDPEYTSPLDIQEDAHDRFRTDGRKYFYPRGGLLQFQYLEVGDEPQEGITALITRMLQQYASANGPEFEVTENKTWRLAKWESTVWDVRPVRWRNSQGQMSAQVPILDTLISIPEDERNGLQMLAEICAQLTAATGLKVGVGVLPINILLGWHGKAGFGVQPARDILEKFLTGKEFIGAVLDWRLFYVPTMYALNISGPTPPPISVTSALKHPAPPPKPRDQALLPLVELYSRLNTPAGISAFQSALASRGYYQGNPTGQWDQKTIAAMRAFQQANFLRATTRPDPMTLHMLNLTSGSTLPPRVPRR